MTIPPTHTSRHHLWLIPALLLAETIALGWASRLSGQPLIETVRPFSLGVATLILLTGLFPALAKPSSVHTLIACFGIMFTSLLIVPLDFNQLPTVHPNIPLVELAAPILSVRLVNGVVLLALAVHVSARFPFPNPRISTRAIVTS